MRSYFTFFAANPRLLTFGFMAALLSSFGQTFFIALFGGELRAAFDLGHGAFGTYYSAATLASGLMLIALGGFVDRVSLRPYTVAVCLGLALASLAMAAATTVIGLVLAFFLLRLIGQGLLSHLSAVATARTFTAGRGKAVSVAALGHPAGEAILPIAAVAGMALLGWRGTWIAIALVTALIAVPMMLRLVSPAAAHNPASTGSTGGDSEVAPRSYSMAEVLRRPHFYPLILCILAPSVIVTGLFFHQAALAESKGWSLSWLATCFVGFATMQVAGGIMAGSFVDRLSVSRMLPFYLVPLSGGALVLSLFDHPVTAAVYMALAGLTAGGSFTVLGALWPELYGTKSLGAIRGLVQALMVLGTAAAPVAFGVLLDAGVGFSAIALGCAAYAGGAALVLALMKPRLERHTARQAQRVL